MLTREECILKAKNAERLAEDSDTEATREAFIAMARKWRALAGALTSGAPSNGKPAEHQE